MVGSFLIETYVSESPNNVVILFMYVSLSIATVTFPLSAYVKIILGCPDINLHVSDFNFNCLSVGDVKIGEEIILFKIE